MDKKLETNVYSTAGKEVGTLTLPEVVFGAKWNADLVHEVVVSMQGNARAGTAHTKTRGEVRGGGKKPWRQKGTGRARHGSSRSPIWVGGGVAHGPRNEKDYSRKINRNARAKAFAIVLSKKFADGEMLFVDNFGMTTPKTKDAKQVLMSLSGIKGKEDMKSRKRNLALIALPMREEETEKSFRNFGNVHVSQIKDINPVELLTYKYVIVAKPDASLKLLTERAMTKSARVSVRKGDTAVKA